MARKPSRGANVRTILPAPVYQATLGDKLQRLGWLSQDDIRELDGLITRILERRWLEHFGPGCTPVLHKKAG